MHKITIDHEDNRNEIANDYTDELKERAVETAIDNHNHEENN